MDAVRILLPKTVLDGMHLPPAPPQDPESTPRVTILVEGPSSRWATVERADLVENLNQLSILLRRWVFHNGQHQLPLLSVRINDLSIQAELPPNVSASEIEDKLSGPLTAPQAA